MKLLESEHFELNLRHLSLRKSIAIEISFSISDLCCRPMVACQKGMFSSREGNVQFNAYC